MSKTVISAEERNVFGSRASQKFRAAGKVPVTVSRRGEESLHVVVAAKDAEVMIHKVSTVVFFDIAGTEQEVLVKDFTRDPVHDGILHVDTIAVKDEQVVKVAVRVVADTRVDCPGLKAGGLLEQMMRRVVIRCPAGKIPDSMGVDLTGVKLGQTVYAEAVQLPEGAVLVTKPRTALLTIIKTRGMRRAESVTEEDEV
ncbi:MAG: 50S ribosomal protein L25 [Planctomycetota bacterium]|jgi:large subunit ribosomal protein L25|nr:50S ribosomal protein L25 [Planctomycetota bacterium]